MQFDSHSFTAEHTGVYVVCFSNEFSTFSHKLVYFDFQVGDEQPLPGVGEHVTVMTQVVYYNIVKYKTKYHFNLKDGVIGPRYSQSFENNSRFSNTSSIERSTR